MTPEEVVAAVDGLFVGRRDVYGEGYPADTPNKYRYMKVEDPLTPELLRRHLTGEVVLGVYPLLKDSTVQWFAVDLDAPKGFEGDPYPAAYEQARKQQEMFERAGLVVYLERSRSGTGVHVWGFLDAPVPAALVRQALAPHLLMGITYDRTYPVQDVLTGSKEYGNLLCLPYQGGAVKQKNGMFLDELQQPIPVRDFLLQVQKNSAAVIQHLAAKAPRHTPREPGVTRAPGQLNYGPLVSGFLKLLSPYGCEFMRHCWTDRKLLKEPEWYAMLQVAAHFRGGREIAHLMSRDYTRYDAGSTDAKFDQALSNERIGCQYIHDNFPEHACGGCPLANGKRTAPHHLAKRSILDLASASAKGIEHVGSFKDDLSLIRRYDSRQLTSGYKWNIPGLDLLSRLRASEMTVIGGQQSMGKTHVMTDSTYSLGYSGVNVFVFSAETGRVSHRQRLLARAAQIDSRKLRGEHAYKLTKEEFARLEQAATLMEEMPIYCDYTSITADEVLAQVERIMLEQGIGFGDPYVVFFDYLQFGMKTAQDSSEYERLSRLSSEFKFTAKITEHPVVVFSQLQREREGCEEPAINWFKGTGRIESDMDVGLIIVGPRIEGERAPRSIWSVKQREGPANVKVDFLLEQTYGQWLLPSENNQALLAVGA